MNDNDLIREKILEYLYELNKKSRSPTATAIGIRELQSELKNRFSYKQQQVSENVSYLIDRKWVVIETTEREFKAQRGTILHPKSIKYRIAADGIDYIEGPSRFKGTDVISNINIHNISGIVTVGNFNTIINKKYESLFSQVDALHRKILSGDKINDEQRLNLSSDIESLKNQLSKTAPDKQVILKLWGNIKQFTESAATLSGCLNLISNITSLIHSLFL